MSQSKVWPWVTVTAIASAWLVALVPPAASWCLFDRTAIIHGEFWRLWTGHWIHFSSSHLLLDTAILGLAGSMVERRDRGRWLIFLAAAPCIISAGLLAFLPGMEFYGGLSGLATGAVVLWGLDLYEQSPRWKMGARWVLIGIGGKIILECAYGTTAFVDLAGVGVYPIPLSHLLGAVLGLVLGWCFRQPFGRGLPQNGIS